MEEFLPVLWFVLIAVLWLGYLFLEGFDLGVGVLMKTLAKNEKEQRVLLNTIGPVWDGNQVWLLTAGGATFAAFPLWYASLFSTLYLPLTLALLALIFRAVAIEYRGKGNSDQWRSFWTWAMALGSGVAAFCVGAMLALTSTGLPLNENGDNVGGPFAWVNIYAIIGGLGVLGFSILHGLMYTSLKTDGEIRMRAQQTAVRWAPVLLAPIVVWVVIVQLIHGALFGWAIIALVAILAAVAWLRLRAGAEKQAFIFQGLFLVAGVSSVFSSMYPLVLPSTIDMSYSLTAFNASSSTYTLGVMSWVAVIFVPLVLGYSIYSYSLWAKRITVSHIPEAHSIPVAARAAK